MEKDTTLEQKIEIYNKLYKQKELGISSDLLKILEIQDDQQLEIAYIQELIQSKLGELSIQIQAARQQNNIKNKKNIATPHLDDTLRSKRLSEKLRYEQRLQYILSHPQFFTKINPDYLKTEKAKYSNKGAVEVRVVKDFIQDSLVIDPTKIGQEMQLHLLEGELTDQDPYYTTVKKHLAHPYYLNYKIPGKVYDHKHPHETTSRITFFRNSPAIGVFRSADTHPVAKDPTKHGQRKINKDMELHITNSSYDLVTQQYQSIQHLMKNKELTNQLLSALQDLQQNATLDDEQKALIRDTIESIKNQRNPHILMMRLYNLQKIQNTNHPTIQQNLLLGAINKCIKRAKLLADYLYYMIPQLQELENIHNANQENMETLHRNTLMCASGNNPWSFAIDTWERMEQFNKHDIGAKVKRSLRQHTVKQEDHLIGLFYSMHQQIQTLLRVPNSEEKNKAARIIVYSHRLIMAAEQLKQDIQLGKVQRPEIDTHTHFQEIWADIYTHCDGQTIQESFGEFYEIMKNIDEHIRKNRLDKAVQTLNIFKSALEK